MREKGRIYYAPLYTTMCNNICHVYTRRIRLTSRRYSFVFVDEDYLNYAANFSRRAQSRVITLTNECEKNVDIIAYLFLLSSFFLFFFSRPDGFRVNRVKR